MLGNKALVVLSGGQDSTTCLYWAKQNFEEVHAITFNYNQRHSREIDCAIKIATIAQVTSHEVVDLGPILKGTSPLVDSSKEVGQYESVNVLPGGVEPTFIPCRNDLFLTIAANRAICKDILHMVTGVCQEDYGGYPDCRRDYIDSKEISLSLANFGDTTSFKILTPLMYLTKKASVELAVSLPECYDALKHTHTCYNGQNPPCGKCHACLLRSRGFDEAGYRDPIDLIKDPINV